VEWKIKDGEWIISLRITLSDGTTSQKFGTYTEFDKSFDFPEDRPVRSVKVRHNKTFVFALQFNDAEN